LVYLSAGRGRSNWEALACRTAESDWPPKRASAIRSSGRSRSRDRSRSERAMGRAQAPTDLGARSAEPANAAVFTSHRAADRRRDLRDARKNGGPRDQSG